MPDLTMCTNHKCPKAEQCYRHEAEPKEHWQSYAGFESSEKGCEMFMKIEKWDRLRVKIIE